MAYQGNPFDVDEVARLAREARDWLLGSRRLLLMIGAGAIALLAVVSSYYQVEADEVALVTRFGRFIRTSNPGP